MRTLKTYNEVNLKMKNFFVGPGVVYRGVSIMILYSLKSFRKKTLPDLCQKVSLLSQQNFIFFI